MDCNQARLLGMLARRAGPEIEPDERDAYHQHLQACADCQAWDESESRFEGQVARTLRSVPIPLGLQQRVLDKVLQRARPRPWVWLTAAAALFVGVGIAGLLWWDLRTRPVDPLAVYQHWQRGADREHLLAWLKQHGYGAVPECFDYAYLHSYEMVEAAGRRVPRITLFYPGDRRHNAVLLHIFVFHENAVSPMGEASGHNLVTLHQTPYTFLTITTGGSDEPLRIKPI
jgi:hypothetical protein